MRKNITVALTNERIILSGGLAVVGAILGKSDFVKRCNRMKVECNHPQCKKQTLRFHLHQTVFSKKVLRLGLRIQFF